MKPPCGGPWIRGMIGATEEAGRIGKADTSTIHNFAFGIKRQTMSTTTQVETIIRTTDKELYRIGEKVIAGERITPAEGLTLFEKGELSYLGALANYVREKLHGDKTYFNRNFHIEPTNVCVFSCAFCAYS